MESFMMQDECKPIVSVAEVLQWKPSQVKHSTVPISKIVKYKRSHKVLVCHDMKGGYLEDRFVHGVFQSDCFSFIHWQFVDIFVYFSHSFVTIPPCSWINAAHKNGVSILGTVITEHEEGAVICKEMFSNEHSVSLLCNQLVEFAVHYGFDGWLINIENKIMEEDIPLLVEFLRLLTQQMHAAMPESNVIWYDSVTKDGELKWQNALNEYNKLFFDVCDGIYLNYNWKEEELNQSVLAAGLRSTEVYAGIDVFGRGSLGGGGFNTKLPFKLANDTGLSIAIFAPGWIFECLDSSHCLENSFKFWDELSMMCSTHCFRTLPFSTTFCPGFGRQMFRQGKVIDSKPWYDLSQQQPQPIYVNNDLAKLELCNDDAFSGGGCIKLISNHPQNSNELQFKKLFSVEFCLEKSYQISYMFKCEEQHYKSFSLVLSMNSCVNRYFLHLVDERLSETLEFDDISTSIFDKILEPKSTELHQGWMCRTYILLAKEFKNHIIDAVEARCSSANVVWLGNLEIMFYNPGVNFHCDIVNKYIDKNIIFLKCQLYWNKSFDVECFDIYYQVANEPKVYLKSTTQEFLDVELQLTYIKNLKLYFYLCSEKLCRSQNCEQSTFELQLDN